MKQALEGDREALRALLARLTPVIQARVVRALLLRQRQGLARAVRQEVEDLTQEVFVALFDQGGRALLAWDPTRGLSLENFVGLVTQRQVASIFRSGRRSPWTEDPTEAEVLAEAQGESPSPEDPVLEADFLDQLLLRFREQATPLALQMFELLWVRELPVASVCEQVGMREDAVYAWRSRLRRTIHALAADLQSETGPRPRMPKVSTGEG